MDLEAAKEQQRASQNWAKASALICFFIAALVLASNLLPPSAAPIHSASSSLPLEATNHRH